MKAAVMIAQSYTLGERLHEGRAFTVVRARDNRDGSAVILKQLACDRARQEDIKKLRHEHDILKALDMPGVVQVRGIHERDGTLSLVCSDFGGETLAARFERDRPDLATLLRIAVQVSETLGQIHGRHVIHKDIQPSHILADGSFHTQIISFGLATRLPREVPSIKNPNVLEGTLAYISPEQTGRMNRAVDYRTDLYSLGVTLYWMLTGQLPFSASDPLELVHCHIAKNPVLPCEVSPSVPEAVSGIVMKLLAKTAEDRYKSAFGLRRDLEECLDRLGRDGFIAPFAAGARDVSDRFQIPQKLYGRDVEIAMLERAFLRVCGGVPELLLVTGPSGAGKSAVIRELDKVLGRRPGYFVSGKFEKLKPDFPYSAILQAFDALVEDLLSDSDEGIAAWRQAILAAAGSGGRVLVDVLPRLEIILGKQPPVIDLPPAGAKNRFQSVFQSFVRVFTRSGRPLVVFLDDLQWADTASLDLLASLLGDAGAGSLLVIGSYRDNEISAPHPLLAAIAQIEKAGCPTTRIEVNPLSMDSIHALVTDTLAREREDTRPLAELVWKKTHGNAFFAGQFLITLYKQDLIEFDTTRLLWTWDTARIETAPSTDNVVELMAVRARSLPARTLEVLERAACMGNRFDPQALSMVTEHPVDELAAVLAEAVEEGLVIFSGTSYRFLHDRVQQAVYTSIPRERWTEIHHQVGLLLLQNPAGDESDEHLFHVVHHLNIAEDLIRIPEERSKLARLNLSAGRKAKASAAFDAASAYFAAGIRFLPAGAWRTHYEPSYALHLSRFECEFLSGRFEEAERVFDVLLREIRTDLEKAQAYEIKVNLYNSVARVQEAIATVIEALGLLDVKIPARPGVQAVLVDLVKTKRALGGRSPSALLNSPEMTDPRKKLALRMILGAVTAAYQVNQNLSAVLMLRSAALSARYGASSASAIGYMYYAMIAGSMLRDFQQREEFGRLALTLVERYPDRSTEATVKVGYGGFIQPWRNPLRAGFAYLTAGMQIQRDLGEHVLAVTTMLTLATNRWVAGCNLDQVLEENDEYLSFARKTRNLGHAGFFAMLRRHCLTLKTSAPAAGSACGEGEREATELAGNQSMTTQHIYRLYRMQALCLLGEYGSALEICRSARKDVDKAIGLMTCIVDYYFYSSLIHAAVLEPKSVLERQRILLTIRRNQWKMKKWADNAPENFRHKYLLVAAELARIARDDHAAIRDYEQAIASARKNDFLQDEAIALELSGRFYLSRGLADFGKMRLARARSAYERWGALAKVAWLDKAYPGLDAAREARSSNGRSMGLTTAASMGAIVFDAPSMIKASQALSSEISLDKLLERLMKVVVESTGAERGALLLRHDGEFRTAAEISPHRGAVTFPDLASGAEASQRSALILQYVSRTQESVILSDAANDGPFTRDAYIAEHGIKSVLCMPLMRKGEVTGVLYLENNLAPGAFTEERVQLLGVLCTQMAISVENARLYAGLEQIIAQRTKELEKAQARLVKLEKDATEVQMAGGFAHEMRNALVGAKLSLQKLYTGQDASLAAENSDKLRDVYLRFRDHVPAADIPLLATVLRQVNTNERNIDYALTHIRSALDRALEITQMILEYARLGQELPGDEQVVLAPVVQSIVAELEADFRSLGICVEVSVDPALALPGKRAHIDSILKNVIWNARDALAEKHGAAGRVIRVECQEQRQCWVLRVSDNGAGIPPKDRERVFEPFFSTKPSSGTGLGLAVVRKLVSLYQGTIAIDSEVGRRTTVEMTFPR